MGRFARVATATAGGGGAYMPHEDGKHKVLVHKAFVKDTRNDGDAFIVDFEILETTSSELKVGAKRGWYRPISAPEEKGGENARCDLKLWMFEAFPETQEIADRMENGDTKADREAAEAEWDELLEWVLCSGEDPATGMIFEVKTTAGKTGGGGPFTYFEWKLLEDPNAEQQTG